MQSEKHSTVELPPIPAKRYFAIGEVAELCLVKPHVLRYWEQEFAQLRPVKRSGNRRYYQHHEVLLVRRIRHLLYAEGFTIIGARAHLEGETTGRAGAHGAHGTHAAADLARKTAANAALNAAELAAQRPAYRAVDHEKLRKELLDIANMLQTAAT